MRIFVSHSTEEKTLADALAKVIRAAYSDVDVRYSSDFAVGGGIDPGEDWYEWILEQVQTSQMTLVVLTHQSTSSPWLLWEAGAATGVALAARVEGSVVPCLYGLDPKKVPAPLAVRHCVNAENRGGVMKVLELIARRSDRNANSGISQAAPNEGKGSTAEFSFLPDGASLSRDLLNEYEVTTRQFSENIAWRRLTIDKERVFVLFPSLRDDPFYLELLSGLTSVLPEAVDLSLHSSQRAYSGPAFTAQVKHLVESQAHYRGGIIGPTLSGAIDEELRKWISQFRIPIVLVDINPFGSAPLPENVSYVGYDNAEGGRLAAQLMLHELGEERCSSVLVLASRDQLERSEAFRRAMPSNVDCRCEFVQFTRQSAFDMIKRFSRRDLERIDGIFGVSDEIAIGAFQACCERMSSAAFKKLVIIGFDGSAAAKTLINLDKSPFRNTIVQDAFVMGERAFTMLRDLIQGRPTEKIVILTVEKFLR